MAYTPKQWVCGETITADGLNNIEEGVQDALECCEDKGFECTETSTLLTEESVTTANQGGMYSGQFSYSTPIDASSLTATFEGTDYELDKVDLGLGIAYGDWQDRPDFTNYPLAILSSNGVNMIFTETAGTYSVKLVANQEDISTSECFEKAVKLFGLKYVADAEIGGGVLANGVNNNTVTAQFALAEGFGTTASGNGSHAEGAQTTASGNASHAEGFETTASDVYAHAEGYGTKATNDAAHAEGYETQANGYGSHAEGLRVTASGNASHAEGTQTTASGNFSHAEGSSTTASGGVSHAEGFGTTASGDNSHAQNEYTIAQGKNQTAIGKFNIAQGTNNSLATTDYALIIGNGTSNSARSNALAIKWDGTFVFANGTEITPAQFASLLALL